MPYKRHRKLIKLKYILCRSASSLFFIVKMPLKDFADEILTDDFIRPQDNLHHLKDLNEMHICNTLFQ